MNQGISAEQVRKQAEQYLAECTEYTDVYEHEKLVRDWEKKGGVAKNVVNDFEKRAGPVGGKSVLDIGFGNGLYAVAFGEAGALASGLEVNEVLWRIAVQNAKNARAKIDLRLYDGGIFPHASGSFDYAFSVSVLEHVSDPGLMLREAARVLKEGGRFYLAFPNRLAPKETHTGVWGLSYMPRSLAAVLLRAAWHQNTIEEINLHFISFWKMKRMARKAGFRVLYEDAGSGFRHYAKWLLAAFGIHHSAILRTVMVVLEKKPI
ncbi:class I SAM-dependent methyltransferase [Candidatus Kaiserbacteria bacterium]|nr:class I SAM-dependent methyltransferase [Candidatus Kaiserbacteria bacterium]